MNQDLKIIEIARIGALVGRGRKPAGLDLQSRRGVLGCLRRWVHIIQVLGFRNLYKQKQEIYKLLEVHE